MAPWIGISFFPPRPRVLLPMARRADALGFESIWVPEHIVFPTRVESLYPYEPELGPPLPGTPLLDPLVTLAYVAAATERVRLGTGIYLMPARHPLLTARAVASLDVLSGGRALLGIGVGWLAEELEAVGSEYRTRGARTDEIVAVVRRLWSEPAVASEGPFYPFPEVGFEPKPVRGSVPILVGGESEAALRRAARLGDGWTGMEHDPASAAERVARLRALRAATPRAGEPLEITVQCKGPHTLDAMRRYAEAGVDRVILRARTFSGEDRRIESSLASLERFADEVIAKLEPAPPAAAR